ncbi:MAG: pentapeptide repeat-containing protein [Elusimicrobiales bacterium]|nr:pentapeptide repeat-containing protein [Elusimicrobiales bacterium]
MKRTIIFYPIALLAVFYFTTTIKENVNHPTDFRDAVGEFTEDLNRIQSKINIPDSLKLPEPAKAKNVQAESSSPQLIYKFNRRKRLCLNSKGERGYNNIIVEELIKDPSRGECADLRNTDLSKANLNKAELKGATYDGGTDLPFNEYEARDRGMIWENLESDRERYKD